MNLKSLFNLRKTNNWIIAMSIAANLLWSFFVMVYGFIRIVDSGDGDIGQAYVILLIGEFLGPLLIGWYCGWLAFDGRGPTYGVVGALGSILIILITLLASGWIAILFVIVALAGGLNGGMFSRFRRRA